MLKCKLCGFESKNNLAAHIPYKHDISCNEYKDMFPGEIVFKHSKETKERQSKIMKDKYQNDIQYIENVIKGRQSKTFTMFRKSYWIEKYSLTEHEAEKKVSELQAHKHTDSSKLKISKAMAGDNNPSSYATIMKKNNCSRDEAKKLMPCYGRSGKLHPMFGKTHSDETKIKIAQSVAKRNKKNNSIASKLEIELFNMLKEKVSNLVANSIIIKHYICDIIDYNSKKVIEFNGDFWHCNPNTWKYDDYHTMLNMYAHEKWELDAKKIKTLNECGYDVLVIWEYDFLHKKKLTLDKCLNFLLNSKEL